MDLATVIGIVSAFGLVIASMALGPGVGSFVDVTSVLIVIGGTFGATLIAYPLNEVLGLFGVVMKTLFTKTQNPNDIIRQLVDFASRARRDGILALESAVQDVDDVFLSRGVGLAVDGQEPDSIETILQTEIDKLRVRHNKGIAIVTTLGTFAPALGLIGTLIGLVGMLQNMSDPDQIGPAMAIALLTTFYGAILANLIFNPLATKLGVRSEDEVEIRDLTMQGILAIANGDNPRIVEQRLHAFLRPSKRESQFD